MNPARLVSIDYLRAFFSVCVVAVHLGYVFPSSIFRWRRDEYLNHTFGWSDFVNFYVLCLAVPVFILVSAYLFARKPTNLSGLMNRLGRILRLMLFWSILYQIFFFTGYGALKLFPEDPQERVIFLLTAGNTVYYFFLCLIIVTAVIHISQKLSTIVIWMLFGATTLIVGVLPILHQRTGILILALHANPLNFLPLAFAGIGLARLSRPPGWLGFTMLSLGALTAILDWTIYIDPCFFEVNRFALPAYSRPSLIFLSVALMIIALRTSAPENPIISFMARHSLAVYCLHPFFIPVRYKLVDKMHLTGVAEILIPLAVVLALSYLGSIVMGRFLRDDLIR